MTKLNQITLAVLTTLGTWHLALGTVYAQVSLPESPTDNFGSGTDLPTQIISRFLLPILTLIGFIAVIYIILAGLKYVRSGGDPKSVEEAKNRLIYAIVGLIVLILAVAMTQIIDRLILGGTGVI